MLIETSGSKSGQGSTFTVLFPACPDALLDQSQPARSEQLHTSGKILVIDDEEIVRNLAKAVLEHYGYSVLLAEDGAKGLAQFALSPNEFVMVLLDFAMPGLSSEETLQRLRTIRPELKVLLFSGYSEDALRPFEDKGLAGFLQKPFTAHALAEKVKTVINASQPGAGAPIALLLPVPEDTAHPA